MIPKYEILKQSPDEKTARIKISEGQFEGFVFRYDVVRFFEEKDDVVRFNYHYVLLEAPSSYQVVDEEQEKKQFENIIGDILHEIIALQIKKNE